MKYLLYIALGGAGGALARHGISVLAPGAGFPWGTLGVNILGCFGIGILYVLVLEKGLLHPDWRMVLGVGFLGAFTTFSAFSVETLALMEDGRALAALGYVLFSVIACMLAVWLAASLARLL